MKLRIYRKKHLRLAECRTATARLKAHRGERIAITLTGETLLYHGWDKGLDFQTERRRLENFVIFGADTPPGHGLLARRRAYAAICLIALVNGSRVSEAIECALLWAETAKNEYFVRVRKRRDVYNRLMIVPHTVRGSPSLRPALLEMAALKTLRSNVCHWSERNLGYNVHALRFCWITDMAKDTPPQVIAKATGHKQLQLILHYTSRKAAEDKLRERIA